MRTDVFRAQLHTTNLLLQWGEVREKSGEVEKNERGEIKKK